MPSLIDPSLTHSQVNVAANYLKTTPSSNFGTRQLTVIKVALDTVYVNYANPDSFYSRAVRALQLNAEVYAVNAPTDASPDYFTAIVAYDTLWDGQVSAASTISDASYDKLEAAINDATGGTSTVTVATIS
jgi:hypothetical protein